MNWHSTAEFLEMGGYGFYVWGSFLMTAFALAWEGLTLGVRRRRALDMLLEERADDATA